MARSITSAPSLASTAATLLLLVSLGCAGGNNSITFAWMDADCDGIEDAPGGPDLVFSDADADAVGDACDNCPAVANGPTAGLDDQHDADRDGLGNACDPDADGDGIANAADNCPLVANSVQSTADADSDGIPDSCDRCPLVADATDIHVVRTDCNGDGDTSDVGEGIGEQCDQDGDGLGNDCDTDRDGDGVAEDGAGDGATYTPCPTGVTAACDDNCPLTPNALQTDTDGDGEGDACEVLGG